MKRRPALAIALIAVVLVASWLGIRHAARQSLERGLARLSAALPPDAHLQYRAARPLPLMRGAELHDLTFTQGPRTLTVASLKITGFAGYPTLGMHVGHLIAHGVHYADATHTIDLAALDVTALAIPATSRNATMIADPAALSFRLATADQVRADVPQFHDVTATRAIVQNFGPGQRSTITIIAPQGRTIPGNAIPGSGAPALAMPGSTQPTPPLTIRAAQVEETGVLLADQVAHDLKDDSAPIVPGSGTMDIEALSVPLPTGTFAIAHLRSRTDRTLKADHGTIVATGITLSAAPADLGGRPATVTLDATFDRDTAQVVLNRSVLTIPDAATITLGLTFDKVADVTKPTAIMAALMNMRFVSLDLSFHDDGLIRAVVNHIAAQRHVDAAQIQPQLGQQAQIMKIIMPPLGTMVDYIAAPNGRTLKINLNPPTPIAVMDIGDLMKRDAAQRLQALGLSASAQ